MTAAAMRGFDREFGDLPDYILTITERIWEGRRPDLIRRYYVEDCVVRSPGIEIRGAEAVVASTLEMLHEFPDRRLLGEDVIWAGDDEAGYVSSHRILSTMRHLGHGLFGAATGRPIRARTIADCAVRENRISEEWLVRDRAAIARQIGLAPREVAAELGPHRRSPRAGAATGTAGPWAIDEAPTARTYAADWRRLWEDRRLASLTETRHRAVALELPGGETASGRAALDRFLIGYLAAFPGGDMTVDNLILRCDPGRPARLAMRWSFASVHGGRGRFGPPTGAPVEIVGINHAHVVDGAIAAEWILIDEVAVWQQILRGRAAPPDGEQGRETA